MANETVGINVNIKTNAEGSIGQLKELKKQLKQTAAGSEEFKKLYNQIDDLEDKIKASKNVSKDWIDTLESAGGPIGSLGAGLNKVKLATQSFGGALKATGIGLVVTLIAGLVAAFAESEKATKKLQPLLIGFEKIFNGIYAAVEPVFDAFLDLATDVMPLVTDAFAVAYSAVTSFLQGLGSLASSVGKLLEGDFSGAWDSAKEAVTGFGKRYDEANKRFIDGTKEVTKTEKEELDKRKEAAEKAAAEAKKRKEEELAYEQQLEDLRRKRFEENYKYAKSLRDKDLKDREDTRKKIEEEDKKVIELRDKNLQESVNRNLKVIEDFKGLIQDRNKVLAEVTLDDQTRELAELENQYLKKKSLIEGNESAVTALTEDWEKKKAEIKMKYEDMKISIVQNALSNISNIVGKETIAGKALAVASATIDTYQAANKALKADYGVFGPAAQVARFISVAATIGAGIKNIKEIVKVKVPGNAGGTSIPVPAGVSAEAPITPTAPLINTRTQLDATSIQQLGSATNRAYVLESDVTNSQERIRRINRAARLG